MKQTTLDAYQEGKGSMNIKPLEDEWDYFKELDFIRKKQNCDIIYSQDWSAYNKTQTSEFAMFQDILIELLDSLIDTRTPYRQGRPFNDFKEMIFCCVMRSYYGKSSRRSVSFLDYAIAKGYIDKKPHFHNIYAFKKIMDSQFFLSSFR